MVGRILTPSDLWNSSKFTKCKIDCDSLCFLFVSVLFLFCFQYEIIFIKFKTKKNNIILLRYNINKCRGITNIKFSVVFPSKGYMGASESFQHIFTIGVVLSCPHSHLSLQNCITLFLFSKPTCSYKAFSLSSYFFNSWPSLVKQLWVRSARMSCG